MSPSHSLRCMIKHAAPCHVPCMPAPPSSSSFSSSPHLCDLRQEQHDLSHQYSLQYHPDCFDSSIDISYHTAYIFHACPGMVSTNPPMIVIKILKKRHLISHGVSAALCATIMFILCSTSSQAAQYSPVYLCTSPWPFEDITFREKEMRGILLFLRGHMQGGH